MPSSRTIPRTNSRMLPRGAALAALACAALAAAAAPRARAAEPAPMVCPAMTNDERPAGTWSTRNYDAAHPTALMEIGWYPEPDPSSDRGRIECVYAPYFSRFPYPRLIAGFPVQRPVTPGWMRPAPNDDWLLCSGATMTHFDTTQCPFVPVEAPPEPGRTESPF